MICVESECTKERKPRSDRPGKFYTRCEDHFRISRRNDRVRENGRRSYRANKEERIRRVKKRAEIKADEIEKYRKEWYQKNKEKALAQSKKWAEENPKKRKEASKEREQRPEVKAKHREWEKNNPKKMAAKHKRWRERHPMAVKAIAHRRRIRKIEAPGECSVEQLEARIIFYGELCWICGIDLSTLPTKNQTIDHVIPLAKGGTHWPANLRPACRSCNSRKHAHIV